MERGPLPTRCAAWGGISLGIGTLAYALFSPSNAGCSTNLVVLTHATVTARGCAASSLVAHIGVGMMVLGAVLLLGSFILLVRNRRQVPGEVPGTGTAGADPSPTTVSDGPSVTATDRPRSVPVSPAQVAPSPDVPTPVAPSRVPAVPGAPAPTVGVTGRSRSTGRSYGDEAGREGPIPPGPLPPGPIPPGPVRPGPDGDRVPNGHPEWTETVTDVPVALPPGWYGNPDTPGRPVKWWDGTRLTDPPPRSGR